MSRLSERLKKEYDSGAYIEYNGCPPPKEYSDGDEKKDLDAFNGFMNTSDYDIIKGIGPQRYMGDNTR